MLNYVKNRLGRWRRYNRTLAELQRLSERDLADLGLMRVDIPRIAREAARM